MLAASCTSPAASLIRLPISLVIRAANSSWRSSISSAARFTTAARSSTERRRQSRNAAWAFSITPSMALVSRNGNSCSVFPVKGFTVAYGRSPASLAVLGCAGEGAWVVVTSSCPPSYCSVVLEVGCPRPSYPPLADRAQLGRGTAADRCFSRARQPANRGSGTIADRGSSRAPGPRSAGGDRCKARLVVCAGAGRCRTPYVCSLHDDDRGAARDSVAADRRLLPGRSAR